MEALAPFPRERTWLLPALRAAQEALGQLPEAALAEVAAHLRVPVSEVWGVATGYPELRLAPRGRHHARVCTGVSCTLLGGGELLAEAARRHGVAVGDTGPTDVTVESADCFFECSMAPMIEVDGAYHGRVAPDDVAHLDRWFRAHAHHPAAPRRPAHAIDAASPAVTAPAESAEAALDRLVAAADMRRRDRPALRLSVQMGTCGRAVNAEDLLAALHRAVAATRHRRGGRRGRVQWHVLRRAVDRDHAPRLAPRRPRARHGGRVARAPRRPGRRRPPRRHGHRVERDGLARARAPPRSIPSGRARSARCSPARAPSTPRASTMRCCTAPTAPWRARSIGRRSRSSRPSRPRASSGAAARSSPPPASGRRAGPPPASPSTS